MKAAIGFFFLIFTSATTNAGVSTWLEGLIAGSPKNHGYWRCDTCSVPTPFVPVVTTAIPDIDTFIQAINGELFAKQPIARWTPGSSITVCNSNDHCLTVYYQAGTKLWLPKVPSFPKPAGVAPKVPKSPTPSVTKPLDSTDSVGIGIRIAPIGPVLCTECGFHIVMPGTYAPPSHLIPSVVIIQYPSFPDFTFQGRNANDMQGMNDRLGDRLGWGIESRGLDGNGDDYECDGTCR